MNRSRSAIVRAVGVLALVGLAVGCGSDSDDETSTSGPAAASGTATVATADAWARTSPAMVSAGAAYVTLTASDDDALIGVEVDATIAGIVEVHETVAADSMESDDSMAMGSDTTMAMGSDTTMAMGSDDSAPMAMTMRPIDRLELPAGEAVSLAPGGYHIMMMELAKPLELDQTFTIELIFEKAGTLPVTFTVRDDAP